MSWSGRMVNEANLCGFCGEFCGVWLICRCLVFCHLNHSVIWKTGAVSFCKKPVWASSSTDLRLYIEYYFELLAVLRCMGQLHREYGKSRALFTFTIRGRLLDGRAKSRRRDVCASRRRFRGAVPGGMRSIELKNLKFINHIAVAN